MRKLAIVVLVGLLASCNTSKTTSTSEEQKSLSQLKESTMSKKETVGAFLGAVLSQDTVTMRKLANADYIQHNPFIPTGLEPFIDMLPVL